MKLTGQHKQVYDYLRTVEKATIREIRDNTFPSVQKPCMRISEINRLYKEEMNDEDAELIVNDGKNKSREVYKKVAAPLTKIVEKIEIVGDRAIRTYITVQL